VLPSSRLLFSREVSRDYAEKHMQILLNRKYHCRKALILLRFHLPHNVYCIRINVKIVKFTRVIREKGIVQLHLYPLHFSACLPHVETAAQARFRDRPIRGTLEWTADTRGR
jgi:hypothetical protein